MVRDWETILREEDLLMKGGNQCYEGRHRQDEGSEDKAEEL